MLALLMQEIIASTSMKELVTTLTQRGQITVPAEVRRLLGVKAHDKLAFQIEDGTVRLTPASFTLASAFGSVQPHRPVTNIDQEIRAAKQEKAERTVRTLKRL